MRAWRPSAAFAAPQGQRWSRWLRLACEGGEGSEQPRVVAHHASRHQGLLCLLPEATLGRHPDDYLYRKWLIIVDVAGEFGATQRVGGDGEGELDRALGVGAAVLGPQRRENQRSGVDCPQLLGHLKN